MILRWIDRAKADGSPTMVRATEHEGVPVYIDYRLEPYFRETTMRLIPKGVGPFRNVKLAPDEAFSAFVSNLLDEAFDAPRQSD